jgi:CRP-like cAMP-binding protein
MVATVSEASEKKTFGEMALLDDKPRSATIKVDSDRCGCLVIPKETFLSVITDGYNKGMRMFGKLKLHLK